MFNGWFNDRRPARRVTLKGLHHRTQRPEAHESRVARVARVAAARGLQWQRVVVQRVDVQRGSASEGGGRSWGVDWDFSCL